MPTIKNYGGLPKEYSDKDSPIVILPVPYDGTSTWIKGADKGPDAIIEASMNMELYNIDTETSVCEKGIFTDAPVKESSDPEAMVSAVRKRVKDHLKEDRFVVLIGGEHSVSIGSIEAHQSHHKDISVLQLDAHSDLRPEYEGSIYNHACVMARAKELCPIVQVGIRSMDAEELELMDKNRVFFAKDIHDKKGWIQDILPLLKDKVYITIDLDVFDPSIMPSTGTPEPGGLLWYDILSLLRQVIEKKQVIGFDIVELCPNIHNKSPDFLAAKLIYHILSYRFR